MTLSELIKWKLWNTKPRVLFRNAEDTFDAWAMTVGIQGQYIINNNWNWVAELMFDFDLFDDYYNGEQLRLKIGANYNLDETKYLGFYVSKDLVHGFQSSPAEMGVQFGIDF